MTEDGAPNSQQMPVSARRDPGALAWHRVDDLSPAQVAAMQSMDDARREGLLAEDDARVIERLIRDGHVHGARKRITIARKRLRP